MKIGKNMRSALDFLSKCEGWQAYDRANRATVDAVRRLARLGLVDVSICGCFRLAQG